MKLKSIVMMCCLALSSGTFADNRHFHPKAEAPVASSNTAKGLTAPGYCEIEIINSSYQDVRVWGQFDDGSTMDPFVVYRYEAPHYIGLYYYGYCHQGMNITITTMDGYGILYRGYTTAYNTLHIYPYLKSQAKVEVQAK